MTITELADRYEQLAERAARDLANLQRAVERAATLSSTNDERITP